MSNAVVNRICHAQVTMAQKIILLRLADYADDDGRTFNYASHDRLTWECCMSRRALINNLKELEDMKMIFVDRSVGAQNSYQINPDFVPPTRQSARESKRKTGAPDAHTSVTKCTSAYDAPVHMNTLTSAYDAHTSAPDTKTGAPDAPISNRSSISSESNIAQEPVSEKKTRTQKSAMPINFGLSDAVKAWAAEHGHTNLEAHLDYFKGYVVANGKKYANWDQALMNAIRGDWAKLKGKTWQQPTVSQPVQDAPQPPLQKRTRYATHDTVADAATLQRLRDLL